MRNTVADLGTKPLDMETVTVGDQSFFLFLDIFVHWTGRKITAVAPCYGSDFDWAAHGVDLENVALSFGNQRITARYLPHALDTWEPCVLFDFDHPAIEAHLHSHESIAFSVSAGPYSKDFVLGSKPAPAHDVAMSLIVRDVNRWLGFFLDYYLTCLGCDHIYLYDNRTRDFDGLRRIVQPDVDEGRVTYIPWHYRWRNKSDGKQIGQIPQQAHSLNKFGKCRWIGFFDYDEFLRVPGQTLKEFLADFDPNEVDGLSFGLRWFMCKEGQSYEAFENPLLNLFDSKPHPHGRKGQKLIVAPRDVRFLKIHTLEDGKREVPVDEATAFFHHYCLRPARFEDGKTTPDTIYDDYMLGFAEPLIRATRRRAEAGDADKQRAGTGQVMPRPRTAEEWIRHIISAFDTANAEGSRLSAEVLNIRGMCGRRNRHFLNALCGFEGCRYLEIGSHAGASTCAAMFGNEISAVAIDDWSQFGGPRDEFIANTGAYRGASSLRTIEQNCFTVDPETLGNFDVFYYDGAHSANAHSKAIRRFYDCLGERAAIVIDDWNWPQVRKGTGEAIAALDIPIVFEKEIILPSTDVVDMPRHRGRDTWWNGIYVMVVDKRATPLSKSTHRRHVVIPSDRRLPIEVIVFSKDRACQLEALLRSMERFFGHPRRTTVLYTASSQAYERGYGLLREDYKSVTWRREAEFKTDLLRLVEEASGRQSRHVMFLVDDIVFVRPFTGEQVINLLDDDDGVLAYSLRLGDRIRYCHPRQMPTSPPEFLDGRRWTWRNAHPGYWNYPMSVDGNIYRLSDIGGTLTKIDFRNPNTLETRMADQPIDRPYLACSSSPYLVNLALNLVQDVFRNPHGDYSAESLNKAFLDGLAIDIEPFVGREFPACHIEPEILLVRRAGSRAAPGLRHADAEAVDKAESPPLIVSRRDDEVIPVRRRFVKARSGHAGSTVLRRRYPRRFVKLNRTGKIIWSLCDGQTSVASILEALEASFDNAAGSIRRDVMTTLALLKTHGMLNFRENPRETRRKRHVDLRSMPIYVINCESDAAKRESMRKQLSGLGLRYEFVNAMECTPARIGIAVSHLRILNSKDIKTPFIVLEDDCVFNESFRYEFTIPTKTDALYLGISHFGLEKPGELSWGKSGQVRWTSYDDANLRVFNMLARHAVMYLSERFRRAAVIALTDALAHRDYMFPGDVGLASLQMSHLVLTPKVPICYQSRALGGQQGATERPLTER